MLQNMLMIVSINRSLIILTDAANAGNGRVRTRADAETMSAECQRARRS